MPMQAIEIEKILKAAFPDGQVEVFDSMGNQDYYDIKVKSSRFKSMNKLQQHKLVYKALNGIIGGRVHSITLTTEIME